MRSGLPWPALPTVPHHVPALVMARTSFYYALVSQPWAHACVSLRPLWLTLSRPRFHPQYWGRGHHLPISWPASLFALTRSPTTPCPASIVLSEPASSPLEHLLFLGPCPSLALLSSLYYADKERERLHPLQLPPSSLSLGLSGASSGGRLSSIQPLLALIGVLGFSFVWVLFFLRAPWRSRPETGGASFLFFWNPVVKCAQPLCEMCTSGDNVRLHYWAREYPPILPPRLLSLCGPRGVPGPGPQGAP